MLEVLAVHLHPGKLGQVAICRVVRRLVEPSPSRQELLSNERNVALSPGSPPDELLSAGVCEGLHRHPEQIADSTVRIKQLLSHALQRVLLQRIFPSPCEVSGAG